MPKKPLAKASPSSETVQINLRAPPSLIESVDAWVDKLNAQGHARWTRNAVILAAVERALEVHGEKGEAP